MELNFLQLFVALFINIVSCHHVVYFCKYYRSQLQAVRVLCDLQASTVVNLILSIPLIIYLLA